VTSGRFIPAGFDHLYHQYGIFGLIRILIIRYDHLKLAMKKTALTTLLTGVLLALVTYAANAADFLDIKTFFKLGLFALGLMILSAGYFLVSFLLEWAKETDFFKKVL